MGKYDVYDVPCVKMNTNILRFVQWTFLQRLYSSRQRLYLSNSIFSNISIEQIFLNVKKYNFLTLKKICSIEFLENNELKGLSRYLHLCKLKKIVSEGTREIAKKRVKIQKSPIFNSLLPWQWSSEGK